MAESKKNHAGVNQVTLIGNLGKDPILRQTASGKSVASFRIATGQGDYTQWHSIVAWERTAENVAQYLAKGSQVYVQGRLQTRNYEDNNGITRYVTEVVATQIQFLGRPKSKAEESAEAPLPTEEDLARMAAELPFG